jgi:hypothetical protein
MKKKNGGFPFKKTIDDPKTNDCLESSLILKHVFL